jgi:hypothetical protein
MSDSPLSVGRWWCHSCVGDILRDGLCREKGHLSKPAENGLISHLRVEDTDRQLTAKCPSG